MLGADSGVVVPGVNVGVPGGWLGGRGDGLVFEERPDGGGDGVEGPPEATGFGEGEPLVDEGLEVGLAVAVAFEGGEDVMHLGGGVAKGHAGGGAHEGLAALAVHDATIPLEGGDHGGVDGDVARHEAVLVEVLKGRAGVVAVRSGAFENLAADGIEDVAGGVVKVAAGGIEEAGLAEVLSAEGQDRADDDAAVVDLGDGAGADEVGGAVEGLVDAGALVFVELVADPGEAIEEGFEVPGLAV